MNLVKVNSPLAGLFFGASLFFGLTGISSAAPVDCALSDVQIGSNLDLSDAVNATSCGAGSGSQDFTPTDNLPGWTVNIDEAGGMNNWAFYEREEDPGMDALPGDPNKHDGNTSAIGLTSSAIGDGINSGDLWIANAFDPFLIVLKSDTFDYQWYMFEGQSGELHGLWDASGIFDGQDLSHISIYTKVVPVPAAVWLFGSGLLGLVGVARRKKAA